MRIIAVLALLCLSVPSIAEDSTWTSIDTSSGQVIIPITLDGESARAMLDTGAIGNRVSQTFLDAGSLSPADTMTLGVSGTEFEIGELVTGVVDEYDLIIGLPFLELYIFQVDYPGQRMRIIDRESLDMKKLANVKMRRAPGSVKPQVRVQMNGKVKAWLMFDTGNGGPLMYARADAERKGWLEDYPVSYSEVTGVNNVPAGADLFRLPKVTIGPFEVEDVLVGVSGGGSSGAERERRNSRDTGFRLKKGDKKTSDGNLGYDILQNYIVTLDLKRNRLNLDVPRAETGVSP